MHAFASVTSFASVTRSSPVQVCQLSLSVPDTSTSVRCRLRTLSIPQWMWTWQYLGTATIVSNIFLHLSLCRNFYFCCAENESSFWFIDHTVANKRRYVLLPFFSRWYILKLKGIVQSKVSQPSLWPYPNSSFPSCRLTPLSPAFSKEYAADRPVNLYAALAPSATPIHLTLVRHPLLSRLVVTKQLLVLAAHLSPWMRKISPTRLFGPSFNLERPSDKHLIPFSKGPVRVLVSSQLHAALLTVTVVSSMVWCSLSILFMDVLRKLDLKNHKMKWVPRYLLFHRLTIVVANDSDLVDCQ